MSITEGFTTESRNIAVFSVVSIVLLLAAVGVFVNQFIAFNNNANRGIAAEQLPRISGTDSAGAPESPTSTPGVTQPPQPQAEEPKKPASASLPPYPEGVQLSDLQLTPNDKIKTNGTNIQVMWGIFGFFVKNREYPLNAQEANLMLSNGNIKEPLINPSTGQLYTFVDGAPTENQIQYIYPGLCTDGARGIARSPKNNKQYAIGMLLEDGSLFCSGTFSS